MRKIKLAIISGKGGVGKSMVASSFLILFSKKRKVVALDCDVDAPNLSIWLNEFSKPKVIKYVKTNLVAKVNQKKCKKCDKCISACPFGAIEKRDNKIQVNEFLCEGCGVCEIVCPAKAFLLRPIRNGKIIIRETKYGFPLIEGSLIPGRTGSGKIVDEVKKEGEKFDYQLMIIDSAPGTGCPVNAVIRDIDWAIIVTEPTLSGFSDAKKVLKVVEYFGVNWRLIINKWDINKKFTRKIENYFKGRVIGKISYNPKIFQAISHLKPILKTDLPTKKELIQIFRKLEKILYAKT